MPSDLQLSANRANAQKSTGPRTPEGKQRSSANAFKHGLCSSQVVLPCESREEYDQLHEELMHDIKPQSTLEDLIVERLVTATWLSRRAVACMQDAFDGAARQNNSSTIVTYPILMKMKNQNDRTADRCTDMLLRILRDRAKALKVQGLPENGFVPPKNEESAPPACPTRSACSPERRRSPRITRKNASKFAINPIISASIRPPNSNHACPLRAVQAVTLEPQ
ncbi:MAG: hypothetical protein M3Z09_05580 [Acidobacteriota bacterium]|nr:hypothetical protein [Acidobacteriota bacterium]